MWLNRDVLIIVICNERKWQVTWFLTSGWLFTHFMQNGRTVVTQTAAEYDDMMMKYGFLVKHGLVFRFSLLPRRFSMLLVCCRRAASNPTLAYSSGFTVSHIELMILWIRFCCWVFVFFFCHNKSWCCSLWFCPHCKAVALIVSYLNWLVHKCSFLN